jgi:hypothetical protein
LRNWFFQLCQKLQSLVKWTQGILWVNILALHLVVTASREHCNSWQYKWRFILQPLGQEELSLRGQGRSPLKYTNCGLCIILERKVCLLKESWVSINIMVKYFFHHTNPWRQNFQKVLPCRCFGGHCLLAIGLLCEGPTDKLLLSTNQIAKSFVPSTKGCCVKRP